VEFGNPSILGVLDVEKIEGDYLVHFVMLVKVPRGTLWCVIFYCCGYFMVWFPLTIEKHENTSLFSTLLHFHSLSLSSMLELLNKFMGILGLALEVNRS
jgi:hypothetical protein